MSKETNATLQSDREYTWGRGLNTYSLYAGRVYSHTTGQWLDAEDTSWHRANANHCFMFRYLDETAEEAKARLLSPEGGDDVRRPTHYQVFPDVESIEIIARSMTQAEFKGFCMGNVLKYRLRAGKKSELATMEKDLKKADFYKELFEQYKGTCYE